MSQIPYKLMGPTRFLDSGVVSGSQSVICEGGMLVNDMKVTKSIVIQEGDIEIIQGNMIMQGKIETSGDLSVGGAIHYGGPSIITFEFMNLGVERLDLTALNTPPMQGKAIVYCTSLTNMSLVLPTGIQDGRIITIIKDIEQHIITLQPGNGDTIVSPVTLVDLYDTITILYNASKNLWIII